MDKKKVFAVLFHFHEKSRYVFESIKSDTVEMYGPMPSMVYRVKNRYRMNIFVKGTKKNIDRYKKILYRKINEFSNNGIRITVDVDPINLL